MPLEGPGEPPIIARVRARPTREMHPPPALNALPRPDEPRDASAPGRRVLKFGGEALRDGPAVRRACEILLAHGGPRPVAVVSAPAGVTEQLDEAAREAAAGRFGGERVRIRLRTLLRQLELESELLDRLLGELFGVLNALRERGRVDPAARDFVLSLGERASARIVARALRASGREATPVDAFDLGLTTDSNHGSARPMPGAAAVLAVRLAALPGVPVLTGFLAADRTGAVTTLGRNGSDLTATLAAEGLVAEEVQLWKPVDGVHTADPRLVPRARRLDRLDHAVAAELARRGASVLHPDALEPLQRCGIPVHLRCVHRPEAPGTRIVRALDLADGPEPLAVAIRPNGERAEVAVVGPAAGRPAAGGWEAALEAASVRVLERAVAPLARVYAVPAEDGPRAARALHARLIEDAPAGARPLSA